MGKYYCNVFIRLLLILAILGLWERNDFVVADGFVQGSNEKCGSHFQLKAIRKPLLSRIQIKNRIGPMYIPYSNSKSLPFGKLQHSTIITATSMQPLSTNLKNSLLVNVPIAIALSIIPKKVLTSEGLVHATMLGLILHSTLGFSGWFLGTAYFLLGSAVTKFKLGYKQKIGVAEARGGARGPANVWGSAATSCILAILSCIFPSHHALFKIGFVSAFATKLSDTFATEIGTVYGTKPYLLYAFKQVPPGTSGAVSLEGTAAGIVGSLLLTMIARNLSLIGTDVGSTLAVLVSAFVATNIESLIGELFQSSQGWLTNEAVNFINTVIGALISMIVLQFAAAVV